MQLSALYQSRIEQRIKLLRAVYIKWNGSWRRTSGLSKIRRGVDSPSWRFGSVEREDFKDLAVQTAIVLCSACARLTSYSAPRYSYFEFNPSIGQARGADHDRVRKSKVFAQYPCTAIQTNSPIPTGLTECGSRPKDSSIEI